MLLPAVALADLPAASVPATPAGRALISWLDAFNSDDRGRIEAFDDSRIPWLTLDRAMALREHTGGYQLVRIDKSDALWITFTAKEKGGLATFAGSLVVESGNTQVISSLAFAPAEAKAHEIKVDDVERHQVLRSVSEQLEGSYVFPDVAKRMTAALRKAEKRDAYRNITDGYVLAERITDDLRAVDYDKHLEVRFSWQARPAEDPTKPAPPDPAARRRLETSNCGFEKADHLAENIGYLKFNYFGDPEVCKPIAAAAMSFLADSDVLILDLRDNTGGLAGIGEFIAGYLFAERTHLDNVYTPRTNTIQEHWTASDVPGKKFTDKPVVLLTSKRTISAAEAICYSLKNLKRAILIGETTAGGAHPIRPTRIDDHFSIIVPIARSISPITKTDWEGTGVEPDIKVPATDALEAALKWAAQTTGNRE
jgi:hypothetical protein